MIYDKLCDIVCRYFKLDKETLSPETSMKDIGKDSLDMVELVLEIEDVFELEVDDDDVLTFSTLGDVVNFIEKKTK